MYSAYALQYYKADYLRESNHIVFITPFISFILYEIATVI